MVEQLISLYPFAFFGTVMCLAVAEMIIPARHQNQPVSRRWATNIGLYLIGFVINRFFVPVSVVAVAELSMRFGHGILQHVVGPGWVMVAIGVLLLDLSKYIEHRLRHAVPILWRLHLVHHSDTNADFTTAERHHPLEMIISIAGAMAVIYLFGVPPIAVAIYLLLATVVALIAHGNIRLPGILDRWLPWVVVTPAVHTLHHSAARHETDSNFAMLLTVWDRLFGTYVTSTPTKDADRVIGLEYFRDVRSARLDRVLGQPFLSPSVRRQAVRSEYDGGTSPAP